MFEISAIVDVDVPCRTAYDQWNDLAMFPAFMESVDMVRRISDERVRWWTHVGDVARRFDTVVTSRHEDDRVGWRTVGGRPRHWGLVTFDRLDAGRTKVSVLLRWQPTTPAEWVGRLLRLDRRQLVEELRRFKAFIEARGYATGSRGARDAVPGQNPPLRNLRRVPGAMPSAEGGMVRRGA